MTPERQRRMIRAAQARTHLSVDALWTRYFALGGTAGPVELDAFLNGALDLPADQRDHVALAVNEYLDSLVGDNRAPYSRTIRTFEPEEGPLGALTSLLDRAHLVPPDAAPAAVDEAARRLGVRAVIYLADYGKQTLVPMPGAHGRDRTRLSIDSTLPGLAFRTLQAQSTVADDGQARLWVPILGGVERLGVLDVMVDDEPDLRDLTLLRQCWWLTHYLGHLLVALDQYGDAIDAVRRSHPRSTEAELIWHVLPPLTAGTDRVIVTGRVEPAYDMGGDAFDYALSATAAQFAVFDATGHDLGAGLAAATAVAAYRNARRGGAGLFQQAEAVHEAIARQFDGRLYATGVLAELDVANGRLRYVTAGHLSPLLVRAGRVVRSLEGGRRPLLGLDVSDMTVGEEDLQPGDTIVLYTDGITEARDDHHREFGLDHLTDALHRVFVEPVPLPEVVRRVFGALLEHRRGSLHDDATLVLVQWTTTGQQDLDPQVLARAVPG
ncbi:PP2C family protein-serine/threonine phosphatase [Puerhibacterium puerhi]|uniref:PP2C family protein-serine/threonine phosphatase n=1 Tax=Puerhibacterium puerhi TaxID=2692623 RepID=UPI00135BEB67|nr:PP2C family protein-serine/threonine phosphatase [Puerhibacterium puerhi]